MKNPFKLVGRALKSSAPLLAKAALDFVPGGGMASMLGRTAIQEIAGALGAKVAKTDDDVTAASKVEAALASATADQLLLLKKRNVAFQERKRELDTVDREAAFDNQMHARDSLRQFQGALRWCGIVTGYAVVLSWVALVCFVVYTVLTAGDGGIDYAGLSTAMGLIIALGAAAGTVINLFFGGNPSMAPETKPAEKG